MKSGLIENIKKAVQKGEYALRPHAISHMLAEGLNESDIIAGVLNGRIIEHYIEEDRCLITGNFQASLNINESLHIVIDYWSEFESIDWVDIVTAYIPRSPFWETPYKRGKGKK